MLGRVGRCTICLCGGTGIHKGLKIPRPVGHVGSTPTGGTMSYREKQFVYIVYGIKLIDHYDEVFIIDSVFKNGDNAQLRVKVLEGDINTEWVVLKKRLQ